MRLLKKIGLFLTIITIIFSTFLNTINCAHSQINEKALTSTSFRDEKVLFVEQVQLENDTSSNTPTYDYTIISAVIAAFSSIIGVLAGSLLSARVTRELEKKQYRRSALKGVCSLISELEDNEKHVKKGRTPSADVWRAARQETWFLPPTISNELADELRSVYGLLEDFGEERDAILRANPNGLKNLVQKLLDESKLSQKIADARNKLKSVGTKLQKEV